MIYENKPFEIVLIDGTLVGYIYNWILIYIYIHGVATAQRQGEIVLLPTHKLVSWASSTANPNYFFWFCLNQDIFRTIISGRNLKTHEYAQLS